MNRSCPNYYWGKDWRSMKLMLWPFGAFMMVLPSLARPQAPPAVDPAAKAQIAAGCAKIIQAMKDGSTKALLDVCTPDFTWTPERGTTLSRRQGEVAFRQYLTSRHVSDMALKLAKLAPAGADAA